MRTESWHDAMQMNGELTAFDPGVSDLLYGIVRHPFETARIGMLASRIKDWDAVVDLVQRHRILPTAYLSLAGAETVPPSLLRRLRLDYERNALHNLANTAELVSVLQAFGREDIRAIPFKGVVLAASAYGDLTARDGGDLDVLIRRSDIARATALLIGRGYVLQSSVEPDGKPTNPYCYEYKFARPADGMVVELRWRLDYIRPGLAQDLGLDWVWPYRRTTMLAGAEVSDLRPEIGLLVLCEHGIKHNWSQLVWICDIARLLVSSPDLDWEIAVSEGKRAGLWRVLALGVLLAHQVADAPVPRAILERLQSSDAARRLANHFAEHLFDAPGTSPAGHVPYRLPLLDFRDRVRLLLSLEILRPNERDRATIHLPDWLDPLYYVIRPLRLLMDRSPR